LWRSWDFKKQAAEALKLTSGDMLNNKLIDSIIKEPLGGAHYNPEEVYDNVRKVILKEIKTLSKLDPEKRINKRIEKFCAMGIFKE
jgi:acetyl-CoA carboxylase carboxyl transferase subunit alpha